MGSFLGTQNIPLIFQSSFWGFLSFIYRNLYYPNIFIFYTHWILWSFPNGLITFDVMQCGKEELLLSKDVRFYYMISSIFS